MCFIAKKYNFDRDLFVKQYDQLRSSREMAKLYGCNKGTILSFAKSIGYVNEWEIPQDERDYIIASYETKKSGDLAKELNRNRGIITKVWYDAGLIGKSKNRYELNHDYFENVDASDKAYFLGFLAADGCVYERHSGNCAPMIKLSLKSNDEYILKLFAKCVCSNKPLIKTVVKRYSGVNTDVRTIELVSQKMADDLSKYGIVPRKTYSYKIQELSEDMMPHFFRGYFDGDGSIFASGSKTQLPSCYQISIVGFEDNMLMMQKFLQTIGIKALITYDKREYGQDGKQQFCDLRIHSVEDKYKFLKYIYQDCGELCLKRKKERADMFFDAIKNNYANRPNLYARFLEDDSSESQLDSTGTE